MFSLEENLPILDPVNIGSYNEYKSVNNKATEVQKSWNFHIQQIWKYRKDGLQAVFKVLRVEI